MVSITEKTADELSKILRGLLETIEDGIQEENERFGDLVKSYKELSNQAQESKKAKLGMVLAEALHDDILEGFTSTKKEYLALLEKLMGGEE